MRVCLVPMKPLGTAKERLAGVLSPDARRALSLAMLRDVCTAATVLDVVWVLQSDGEAAAVAREIGAEPRPDPAPGAGLNASFEAATIEAIAAGATGVLLLSADLAAVTTEDVEAIAAGSGIAIAPDRAGTGTNALWRQPPDAIPLAFGPASRSVHEALARERGLAVRVVERPGLALDVDEPADVGDAALRGGPATRTALATLGYAAGRGR